MQTNIRKKLTAACRSSFALNKLVHGESSKKFIFLTLSSCMILLPGKLFAQVTLGSSPYTQNFNSIGSGLPAGWTVWTGATNTSLGASSTLTTAATAWTSATGQFANFASANPPSTSADVAGTQAARTDRALGVRQTNTFGDPGAAFVFEISNTAGLGNFSLTFSLMNLAPSAGRATTWNVDYGFGSSPTSFTNATTSPVSLVTGNSTAWGTTTVTVNFGTALNNNAGPVWIRIATKTASTTGSGGSVRATTAIDDVGLTWNSLTTTTASYGPFCSTSASSINIPFTSTGTFSAGNTYTAQLSDANGSFATPTVIGTLASTANSGTVSATLPAGLTAGSGYRIRVVSSNPVVTGMDNGSDITINGISGQPSNTTVCTGSAATFTVTAAGSPTYQWQESPDLIAWTSLSDGTFSGTTYSGATTTSLTVNGTTSRYYRCIVNYGGCTITSSSGLLSYNSLPSNPPNPTTPTNPSCGSAVLSEASAPSGVSYYWQGTINNGTSTSNNASSSTTATSSGTYYVRTQNNTTGCWSSGSGSLNITINPNPTITTQPGNQSGIVSNSATFSVATSTTGVTYQWRYSANGSTGWSNIANNTPAGFTYSGSTTSSLTVNGNTPGTYYYKCVIFDVHGCSTISNTASLTLTSLSGISATSTIPIGNGYPCGGSSSNDSVMYFNYSPATATISEMSTCKPSLGSPGLSAFGTSVAFNPADGYLYFTRYTSGNSYIWRWQPGTCPSSSLPVYQTYTGKAILGIDFDNSGMGYQIYFTGSSAPYGLALQQVNFTTGVFGPIINIDLQGQKINSQNGDLVITPSGQFLMVWDNKYFTLNYQDYNVNSLVATYISTLNLSGGGYLVGLSYAQGKLVGSASSGCAYYDFNILTGGVTPLTKGSGVQYSTDMTNITSGVGSAKELVSATPVSSGVYDLVYDVYVKNYGDYPISNVQVKEDLTKIHPLGASAISNVSIQWIDNPAGLTLNSSYDGITNTSLLAASQTLLNYPTSSNYFIVRVKFRMSSVTQGSEYDNNAVVTGFGYNNVALQDTSTNGTNPDLNSNDKPDDNGEDQPTPFSISVASESPPCSSINTLLYTQDFGSGTGISTTLPGTMTTQYTAGSNPMSEETYVLTDNANNGDPSKYVNLTDHTGNTNGRMLLINADVQNYKMFEDTVNISCVNLKYTFKVFAANIANSTYNTFCDAFGGSQQPMITLVVRNASNNAIIATYSTSNITDTTWTEYGLKWVMPTGVTTVKLQIYNIGSGGCGNVIALDDVQFGLCDPLPTASTSGTAGCIGSSTTINVALSDTTGMTGNLQYQWQSSTNGTTWTNISGATTIPYTINPFTAANQKYYRVIVAATGNVSSSCQYTSNSVYLAALDTSAAATSATSSPSFICPGQPAILTVHGGSLGASAVWRWFTSSCGGTFIGNGSSISVNPMVTTTYYVRAKGTCNTTQCVNVTLPVTCILATEEITLKGNISSKVANLSWTIISDKKITSMELERSSDGVGFETIKQIAVNGLADKRGYGSRDNVASITGNYIYYRIKYTTDDGETMYSKVLMLSVNGSAFNAAVVPNPAHATAKVSFYADETSQVEIKLFNAQSHLLRSAKILTENGYNSYDLQQLDRLPGGIYYITITNANSSSHLKLIIE